MEDFMAAEEASMAVDSAAVVVSAARDLASVWVSAWPGLMEHTVILMAMATTATLTMTVVAATWFGGG